MMGLGSFLKKVINPLTPITGAAKALGALAKGDVKGALLGSASMGMLSPQQRARQMFGQAGAPSVSDEARAFFSSQSPEDQAAIQASWGPAPRTSPRIARKLGMDPNAPNPMMQQWFDAAKAAGSVPAPAPAAAPPASAAFSAGTPELAAAAPATPAAPAMRRPPMWERPGALKDGVAGALRDRFMLNRQ